MVLSNDSEDEVARIYQELCGKLNLDPNITIASWETFQSISKKFTLEGEITGWLGCAIYTASQGVETPTIDNSSVVKGMGINLTSLLRHSNLSFMQFFSKIASWASMAQLPESFHNKIDGLRNNFSITYNTFKKLNPLFNELFIAPVPNAQDLELSKHKNRKNKAIPCTSLKMFEFIWSLFLILKAENSACSKELIKSHHLLYCCIDFVFKNVLASERRDLINDKLMEEYNLSSQDPQAKKEVPCIVKRFCECESVIKDALHMKVYTFRPLITKLVGNKILIVDESDLTGLCDMEYFDQSFKNVTKAYEAHLVNNGEFDERIFLAEFRRVMMEKEQTDSWTSMRVLPPSDSNDAALLESPKVAGTSDQAKLLDTPLTGRKFLGPRESDLSGRSTSEKVSRLHVIIGNRTPAPSEQLRSLFDSCQRDPLAKIENIISNMKESFIEAYTSNKFSLDEAQRRFDFGVTLFYKYVEMILNKEKTMTSDISDLVEKELFYQSMLACCLEIVLYCYNFPKKFPWILEAVHVEAIHFVKVIELIIRIKDNLFRELVKHLNRIEETVIESLAWKSNSSIWDAIEKSGQGIPKFQDTALPGHLLYNEVSDEHLLQSPVRLSATDRFQSPLSKLCRSLFPLSGSSGQSQRTHIVITDSKSMKILPLLERDIKIEKQQENAGAKPDPQAAALPRRTGSLSIIFRKFYYLAGVRMQHLCSHLGFDDFELRRKIWTIFEDSIRHTDLIKDRHLDQLLMCAIYVICKAGNITKIPNLFSVIMKYYRQQPQASSSVYRDVLIKRAKVVDGENVAEERGDLIHFYNSVYVKAMQTYAVKFQPNSNSKKNVPLSPLPASRKNLASSNLQVGCNVFVKPLEASPVQSGSTFNYYFSRSPSKDLMNINRAINGSPIRGKRLLIDEDSNMPSSKRISNRKIQSLVEDRQRQNASE